MNLYKISWFVIFIFSGIFAGMALMYQVQFMPLLIINYRMVGEMVMTMKGWMDKWMVNQTVPEKVPSA